MMLLQAGQLGLTRMDSIWTSELPPDMVAGATLWLDFTDSATLFSSQDLSGSNVTSNGVGIGSVRSKVVETRYFNAAYSGNPTLKLSAANGRSAGLFGTSSYSRMDAAEGASQAPLSTFVTATTKLIICGVKVISSDTLAEPWNNNAIFSDAPGYVGLHVTKAGSVISARAYNYSADAQEAVQTFAADTWVVITMSHAGGQLRCRVNGGAWASTASGTTDAMSGIVQIANQSTPKLQMELAHLFCANTAQTDAAISAVEHWLANDLGITPWW